MTLHAFKGVVSRRGCGQAGNLREMASGTQAQIARKTKFGINLDHVGQVRELRASGFVKRARRRGDGCASRAWAPA